MSSSDGVRHDKRGLRQGRYLPINRHVERGSGTKAQCRRAADLKSRRENTARCVVKIDRLGNPIAGMRIRNGKNRGHGASLDARIAAGALVIQRRSPGAHVGDGRHQEQKPQGGNYNSDGDQGWS